MQFLEPMNLWFLENSAHGTIQPAVLTAASGLIVCTVISCVLFGLLCNMLTYNIMQGK